MRPVITKDMSMNQIIDMMLDDMPDSVTDQVKYEFVRRLMIVPNYKKKRVIFVAGVRGIYTDFNYDDDPRFEEMQEHRKKQISFM